MFKGSNVYYYSRSIDCTLVYNLQLPESPSRDTVARQPHIKKQESVKIIERFHLLFVSDVRTVYENFVYFILVVFFSFGC